MPLSDTKCSDIKIEAAQQAPYDIIFGTIDSGRLLTIHANGRIELGPNAKPDEAAVKMLEILEPLLKQAGWVQNKD